MMLCFLTVANADILWVDEAWTQCWCSSGGHEGRVYELVLLPKRRNKRKNLGIV